MTARMSPRVAHAWKQAAKVATLAVALLIAAAVVGKESDYYVPLALMAITFAWSTFVELREIDAIRATDA